MHRPSDEGAGPPKHEADTEKGIKNEGEEGGDCPEYGDIESREMNIPRPRDGDDEAERGDQKANQRACLLSRTLDFGFLPPWVQGEVCFQVDGDVICRGCVLRMALVTYICLAILQRGVVSNGFVSDM